MLHFITLYYVGGGRWIGLKKEKKLQTDGALSEQHVEKQHIRNNMQQTQQQLTGTLSLSELLSLF